MGEKTSSRITFLRSIDAEFVMLFRALSIVLIAKMILAVKPRVVNDRKSLLELVGYELQIDPAELEKVLTLKKDLISSEHLPVLTEIWENYEGNIIKIIREGSKRKLFFNFCLGEKFRSKIEATKLLSVFSEMVAIHNKIFIESPEAGALSSLMSLLDDNFSERMSTLTQKINFKIEELDQEFTRENKSLGSRIRKNSQQVKPKRHQSLKERYHGKKSSNMESSVIGGSSIQGVPIAENTHTLETTQLRGEVDLTIAGSKASTQRDDSYKTNDNQRLILEFYKRSELKNGMTYDFENILLYIAIRLGKDPNTVMFEVNSGRVDLRELIGEFENKFHGNV